MQVFVACDTQWRHVGMTGITTGLDYPALEAVMRMMAIDDTRDTFERIRTMESGALEALREQR